MGATAEQVHRGIAGLFILDDPEAAALPLPKRYGLDDIPVIIQDKRFKGDGALDLSRRLISPTGILGDKLLVNGTYDPYLSVTSERIRLRLLNASNARIYNIGFSDDRAFTLIATDGGLLKTSSHETDSFVSGRARGGDRRVRAGREVILRSYEPELGTNFWEGRFAGGDDTFDLLQIRATAQLSAASDLPERLVTHAPLREGDAVKTRRFELTGQDRSTARRWT